MRRVTGAGAWTSEDGRPWSNPTHASLGVEIRRNGGIFIAFVLPKLISWGQPSLVVVVVVVVSLLRMIRLAGGTVITHLMAALQMLGLDGALANGVVRLAIRRSMDGPTQPLSAQHVG